MKSTNFLLTDPCHLMRIGLKTVLTEMNINFCFTEIYTDEEIEAYVRQDPGCIITINLATGGYRIYTLALNLLRRHKRVHLIIFSANDNPFVANLVMLGAKCILTPGATREEIKAAVQTVLAGNVSPVNETAQPSARINLSEKELKVVQLMIRGKTSREMSDILQSNIKTIETYRYRLFRKTGVKNCAELVYLFTRTNMFTGQIAG